jgi:cell division protein FtsW
MERKKPIQQRTKKTFDSGLMVAVGLLVVVGFIMLFSVSTVESLQRFGNTTHFVQSQMLQGLLLGCVALYVCAKIDYHLWQKLVPVIVVVSLLLLTLVKVPGIGFAAGGASRWIHVGPIFFQPAELAKLAIIMYTAAWTTSRKAHLHNFASGLLPMLVVLGLFAMLILWQPDFGTMIALLGSALVVVVASGVPWKWILSIAAAGIGLLFLLIKLEPYRAARLFTFLNPNYDPQGAGYQINQALLAVGSGGLWGLGYGQSRQKHSYLPEVLGDSVFAVIAEELGFVRVLGILALFIFFCIRGFQIASAAPDVFGRLLATGLTAMISLQVIINIAATVGLLPLTGIPLPFFSYGSSALIANLAAVGILLQISKHSKL